jgi:hypothetical protein
MGLALVLLSSPAFAVSPGKGTPANTPQAPLTVHEWGTFLCVQGSDGVSLGGMVDSDEILPPFIEARNLATWQRSSMVLKVETPVTYFYTDRPRDVQVYVAMPKGLLTHWYPPVRHFGPPLKATEVGALGPTPHVISTKKGQVYSGLLKADTAKGIELLDAAGHTIQIAKEDIADHTTAPTLRLVADSGKSFLEWRTVRLIPDTSATAKQTAALKPVGPEQTWRYVRQTDSAFVEVKSFDMNGARQTSLEKFLFYRGLGTYDLPLEIRSAEDDTGLRLTLHNRSDQPLRGLFAIHVENNQIQFGSLPDLAGKERQEFRVGPVLSSPRPLSVGVPTAKGAVAAALVSAGLFPKEAQAMVNTWERSYFHTDGLRVLYLLPDASVKAAIPIQIRPAPDKLVRVMVGRVEVLTPGREHEIEKYVAELGATEFKIREAASTGLARLGRLSEPALRRVLATTGDPEVRARAENLINQVAAGK